jgi:hypothetical protein
VAGSLGPANTLRSQTAKFAADSGGRCGTPSPILRAVESVWGRRSGESCDRTLKATAVEWPNCRLASTVLKRDPWHHPLHICQGQVSAYSGNEPSTCCYA